MKNIFYIVFCFITIQAFSQDIAWLSNKNFKVEHNTLTAESIGATAISASTLDVENSGSVTINNFIDINSRSANPGLNRSIRTRPGGGLLNPVFQINGLIITLNDVSFSADVQENRINGYSLEISGTRTGNKAVIYDHNTRPFLEYDIINLQQTDSFSIQKDIDTNTIKFYYNTTKIAEVSITSAENIRLYVHSKPENLQFDLHPENFEIDRGALEDITIASSKNWISSKQYDLEGHLIGAGVNYFNELGDITQSQTLDFKTLKIWMSETRYDAQGRAALQTLSAPYKTETPSSNLQFADGNNFIWKTDGTLYTNIDFEADTENPAQIGSQENSLGWYYSENNTSELYQDVTDYPFTRTIYSKLNPGSALKSLGGNKIDRGNGPEWINGFSYTVPAAQEVFYLFGRTYFGKTSGSLQIDDTKFYKSVAIDVHGEEVIVITDGEGKTLAAGRSGGDQKYEVVSLIGEQGYVDVHIPKGITNTDLQLLGNHSYTIYDLRTETVVTPAQMTGGHLYRIALTPQAQEEIQINSSGQIVTGTAAKGIRYKVNYHEFSLNYYDKTGRLTETVQPLGFDASVLEGMVALVNHQMKTTFTYDTSGQLKQTTSPDEGTATFVYREDGQIRFSQNSKQSENSEFSYTNYDDLSRPVESGVYRGSEVFRDDPNIPIHTDFCRERHLTAYDTPDITGLHQALNEEGITTLFYAQQNFVAGNVSKTQTINPNTATTWYSYDIYGRLKWMVQKIEDLGTKTIDYEYDQLTGNVTKVYYQKHIPEERFIHRYTYNHVNELTTVETSEDDNIFTEQASYKYYENGSLKRTVLAEGLQGIDYIYNLAGQLKQINHPSREATKDPGGDANDAFGMALDYYTGDYTRTNTPTPIISSPSGTNQYNGNIKATRWSTANIGNTGAQNGQLYQYNNKNWLTQSSFGNVVEVNNTAYIGGSRDYLVSNISYDTNGNLLSLHRNKARSGADPVPSWDMDQLTYHYTPGTNQLDHVDDAITVDTYVDDIKDQQNRNYEYNSIGQLVKNTQENITYTYNTSGLVTSVQSIYDPTTNLYPQSVHFYYDDKGQRVRKEVIQATGIGNNVTNTYYVRDAAGSVMAIYRKHKSAGDAGLTLGGGSVESEPKLTEHPIYGAGRVGIHYRDSNQDLYQLTDHLGNVRAVVARNDGEVKSAADYYPFGMQMPRRTLSGSEGYRYAYQGQEIDPETGKEAFQLRLWDSRIGRWLTTDPYGQYSSPYLGMGNNPINGIDPDGGKSSDWYELLDENGEGTRIFKWYEGNYDITGYRYIGPSFIETYTDGGDRIQILFERNGKSYQYNSETAQYDFLKNYKYKGISELDKINSNLSKHLSVAQVLGETFIGALSGAILATAEGIQTGEMEGISIDGDRLPVDLTTAWMYNNGEWVEFNPYSGGDGHKNYILSYGQDLISILPLKVNTHSDPKMGEDISKGIKTLMKEFIDPSRVDN